jgi:mono/diheme cytochrome c family protein
MSLTPESYRRYLPAVMAMATALIAFGCKPPTPPSKPLADLTPQETSGYAIFKSRCAGCHYAGNEKSLHGPGLQGLYKKRYLPSGAPANDDRVASVILHGRNLMPAFGNNLDEQQVADVIAYLHTL